MPFLLENCQATDNSNNTILPFVYAMDAILFVICELIFTQYCNLIICIVRDVSTYAFHIHINLIMLALHALKVTCPHLQYWNISVGLAQISISSHICSLTSKMFSDMKN
ncbi:hypothetical protein ACJX0J_038376, partial [Zea mays]